MGIIPSLFLAFSGVTVVASNVVYSFDATQYDARDVIVRDIAVIGGGSSGTYGAVNLHAMGQSVILVEKEALLGGHINTYTDPTTGVTVDYGVQAFWNSTTTWDYFELLGISGEAYSIAPLTNVFYDFSTGAPVTVQIANNFTAYAQQLDNYPYLANSWDLPNPLPEDLVLPFQNFVTKYNLVNMAYTIYFYSQGLTNFLQQLTINVFKMFDSTLLSGLTGHDVVPPNHNNKLIFEMALEKLGPSNVLLSSTIVAAQRPPNVPGVLLIAKTPNGDKLIRVSKLLISIPPLLENMRSFDLNDMEKSIFSQWTYSSYYTMLVNNTGLPSGYRFMNANSSSATFNIPELPAPYQVTESRILGLWYVWYGSPTPLTQDEVQEDVLKVIKRLQQAILSNESPGPSPEFVEFRSHTPFKLEPSKENLENGFYNNLNGLQGERNTWYTGAAFISQASGILWNYTHSLLPEIVGK
ncbi:uncharacterized protein N7496_005641 [Penicillium cataractarum]|uniref:Amine oxidase domain-containing protein n=1 Tax=Penicillium cataractarum TaxID=2100454 RepID=A0A9W9SGK0_9EURO|nr:uncharacterized protein N7496_005641 [Penicillium cataractarum]KAJ5378232.1 hypothetical protein N7496_005641 [Penicillium cataractarum]